MNEEYRKAICELLGLPEDSEIELKNTTGAAATNLMICKRLDRIADNLEGINAHLNELEDIMNLFVKCVRYIPSRYEGVEGTFSILISGSVDVGA